MSRRPESITHSDGSCIGWGRRAAGGPQWTTVTSGEDGLAHVVTEQVLAAGAVAAGRFVALCGRLVVPAALSAPPGRPCLLCTAGRDVSDQPVPTGRHRRG